MAGGRRPEVLWLEKRYSMKWKSLFFISLLILLISVNCARKPENGLQMINRYLQLRIEQSYVQQYNLFHNNFQKDISLEKFIEFEKIYNRKFGSLQKYELKKWQDRKNFSCGRSSGRLVAVIYSCKYEYGNTEETFTIIKKDGYWKIFDYYLRPDY